MKRVLFLFQGGGPTAVLNASLAAILEGAAASYDAIYGLRHSFEQAMPENLEDLTALAAPGQVEARASLARTPGAVLGSSRKKVEDANLDAVLRVMRSKGATDIVGIGGNGTMATLCKLAECAATQGQDLRAVGVPKTVDNDLPGVEFAPGFGSAARFVALATRDFDCDFRAMQTFDDVTIFETMGRDTGWLAAASILLRDGEGAAPHVVLVPERPVDEEALMTHVQALHRQHGRVFIATNEMLKTQEGHILGAEAQQGPKDSLGRTMYSLSTGTGNYLAQKLWQTCGLQSRCLRPGNLGRALSFCVSEPDFRLAQAVGRASLPLLDEVEGIPLMLTVARDLSIGAQSAALGTAKKELPSCFLGSGTSFDISDDFKDLVLPII
jgi:6-phosphofructokinase